MNRSDDPEHELGPTPSMPPDEVVSDGGVKSPVGSIVPGGPDLQAKDKVRREDVFESEGSAGFAADKTRRCIGQIAFGFAIAFAAAALWFLWDAHANEVSLGRALVVIAAMGFAYGLLRAADRLTTREYVVLETEHRRALAKAPPPRDEDVLAIVETLSKVTKDLAETISKLKP